MYIALYIYIYIIVFMYCFFKLHKDWLFQNGLAVLLNFITSWYFGISIVSIRSFANMWSMVSKLSFYMCFASVGLIDCNFLCLESILIWFVISNQIIEGGVAYISGKTPLLINEYLFFFQPENYFIRPILHVFLIDIACQYK